MDKICIECGKIFIPTQSKTKLCIDCYYISHGGTPLKVHKKVIKENVRKGETYRKSISISDMRDRIRARDNDTCQNCGKIWERGIGKKSNRKFDVHHLDPERENLPKNYNSEYDMEHPEMLITLCRKCHMGLPHHRNKLSISSYRPVYF